MNFKLKIEMGNDAMQEVGHVEDALTELVESGKLRREVTGLGKMKVGSTGKIRDANGNTVGEWKVTR